MERISIIVPVYKVEAYLDRCVRSIAEQTYENLEIILVDDGSPDSCPAICDAWAAEDRRIRVIHKENGGLSDARNAGLAVVTGALIAFVDSDDWLEKTFLEELYSAMKQTRADIVECAVSLVAEDGSLLRTRGVQERQTMDKLGALRRLIMEEGVYQTVWNKLYRRSMLDGILFEKGKCHEDEFWTYQVFDRIGKLTVIPRPLYQYLQRGSSIMGAGYTVKRLDGLEARYRRMQYLQKYDELAALSRQQLTFDCMWHLQSVLRQIQGDEKKMTVSVVCNYLRTTPKVRQRDLEVKPKYRIWYGMFMAAPILTAQIRNKLRIGL